MPLISSSLHAPFPARRSRKRPHLIGARCLLLSVLGLAPTLAATAPDPLAAAFANPPAEYRPFTFWQWMNGAVTKEGITADLESFSRVGLGGVQQFLVGGSEADITDPTVEILNPKWNDLMAFAIAECARLGLTFGTHNAPGWTSSGGPGVTVEDSMQKLVWTTTDFSGPGPFTGKLPQATVDPRWNFYRDIAVLALPATGDVAPEAVLDLTAKLRPDGSLDWSAPAGAWTILRFGHTTTGAINGTAPLSGQGLEVDKMSREALERYWQTFPEKIIRLAGRHAGRTFTRLEIDSYEVGAQDWTPKMREEFRARRGYELLPWLPVLAGRIVGDRTRSGRFREDWTNTIHTLFAESYYDHAATLTRRVPGMKLLIEPYGVREQPFNGFEVARHADLVMSEFWWGPTNWGWDTLKPVTSSAHTNGLRQAFAESFTGQPTHGWRVAPHDLRAPGDRAFGLGVNHFILHASPHQPWPDRKPGMTMGFWGTQFGPGQTWWEHGGPEWLAYVSRAQFLLQQGLFVGDICWLRHSHSRAPEFPKAKGFDGDFIAEQTLIESMTVKDGRLVLPDGTSYRLLVLPDQDAMTPALARKIQQLVRAGAAVLGRRPDRAIGLRDFPAADAEVAAIGREVWNAPEGRLGEGRVFSGLSPEDALARLGVESDMILPADVPLAWIHRRIGDAEVYFIGNQKEESVTLAPSFRVSGLTPELWHADTGLIERAPYWKQEDGRTTVALRLDPAGSVFVVFRRPAAADPVVSLVRDNEEFAFPASAARPAPARLVQSLDGQPFIEVREAGDYHLRTASGRTFAVNAPALPAPLPIDGSWRLDFQPGRGAPATITLDTLVSWPNHANPGVKWFSGSAVYSKTIDVTSALLGGDRVLTLDLGVVKHIATIRLNGQNVATLWNPPFRADVTRFLKAGRNQLEIKVTNLWPNRLIGDEQLPEDLDWGPNVKFMNWDVGRHLQKAPDWLVKNTPRPSGRLTFTTFKFFNANSPLLESGLLGPVMLESASRLPIR